MIDLHCHVLPGIDDGPSTIEGSLAIVRAAAAAGTRTIVATPHVSRRYPNGPESIARLVDELNRRLIAEGTQVDIQAGAEVAMTHAVEVEAEELARLRLGAGPWMLVEPPLTPFASALDAILLDFQRRHGRIVLAHPERCPAFHRDPQMLHSLVQAGILTSITASSLVGRFGDGVRRFALRLAEEELIHNVASDAHNCGHRGPAMTFELEQAGLGPLAHWLTQAVPAAILSGGPIPPRPLASRRAW